MSPLLLDIFITFGFMLIGYLIGSIPTGYIVAKIMGVDIQKLGSGNIGATNILRNLGVVPAAIVVLIDPLKGMLSVSIPMLLGLDSVTIALTALCTLLGNLFNVFLGFKGGKGVATSMGIFLGIDPLVTVLAMFLGISTIALGRYVSLGSLIGVLSAPVMILARGSFIFPYFFLTIAIAALVFYKHRENIEKLAKGTERRLGEK